MNRNLLAAFALGCLMGVSPCLVATLADGKLRSVPAGGTYLYFVHDPDREDLINPSIANMAVPGAASVFSFQEESHLVRVRRAAMAAALLEVNEIRQEPIRGSR